MVLSVFFKFNQYFNMKDMKTIIAFLLILFAQYAYGQKADYKTLANDLANSKQWISFAIKTEHYKNDSLLWKHYAHAIINYSEKQPFVFYESFNDFNDISKSYYLNNDVYIDIDHENNNINMYKNRRLFWDDYHSYGILGFIPQRFWYLNYYLVPLQNDIKGGLMTYTASIIKDKEFVAINEKNHLKFTGCSSKYYSYTENHKRLTIYNNIQWFINANTGTLDSVFSFQEPIEYENRKTMIKICDFDYSNKQQYVDSVINLNSKDYKNYSHKYKNIIEEKNDYSNDKNLFNNIQDCPIYDLFGQTSTISSKDGWLLVYFWTSHCAPCLKHLQTMGHEKDSLGYYTLNQHDINILAVNYSSDNLDLLNKIAERSKARDIIYFSKDMEKFKSFHTLGYVYLISPDKKIIYKSSIIENDYSSIIKAKKEYEMNIKH